MYLRRGWRGEEKVQWGQGVGHEENGGGGSGDGGDGGGGVVGWLIPMRVREIGGGFR